MSTNTSSRFGHGAPVPPRSGPTSFEEKVSKLGLHESEYVGSGELREWCSHNCDRCYVPEWLLKEWNMHV
jgi:hypothetical protein